jgi:hypothetical protein
MAEVGMGAMRKYLGRDFAREAAKAQSRCEIDSISNPVHGGSGQFIGPFNQAGVGSFYLVTSGTGSDRLGDFR